MLAERSDRIEGNYTDGSTVVGNYTEGGVNYGFEAAVPEPKEFILLGSVATSVLSGFMLTRRWKAAERVACDS